MASTPLAFAILGTMSNPPQRSAKPKNADMDDQLRTLARQLAVDVATATASARKEASLRAVIERHLGDAARLLGIPWSDHSLDTTVIGIEPSIRRYVDAAHGALVLEYEPPRSFREGRAMRVVNHAREQARENASLLANEEGRPSDDYVLVAWDGASITFGKLPGAAADWEEVRPFAADTAERVLRVLVNDGVPLVYPDLLSELVGPESAVGQALLPALFNAIRASVSGPPSKTRLLYTEWRRLFGQVVGVQTEGLKRLLERQGVRHGALYREDPSAYLFALNTQIALVAKAVAALSLASAHEIRDPLSTAKEKIDRLEDGSAFEHAGVANLLSGQDFFAWYADDPAFQTFEPHLGRMLELLSSISFDVQRKSRESLRDLFKGLYMTFAPRELRHALGEYYTPDWLAEHVLDQANWTPIDEILDPTCGSGTFLLEALRRRLLDKRFAGKGARETLEGIYGLDLNPLAVLSARASIVVFLADRLDPRDPIEVPVYLADAINVSEEHGGRFEHRVQTERGERLFQIPSKLVRSDSFFAVFKRIRELVEADLPSERIIDEIDAAFGLSELTDAERDSLREGIDAFVELHDSGWDGIWASILGDRFAAGAIPPVSHVIGNPPWVKWSHLPPEYAEFIKPNCDAIGVFSEDVWVGGIEADISTVITYVAADRWLAPSGVLAFLITGTVFSNESSQGFRRFELRGSRPTSLAVESVEDFRAIRPFDDVTNHPVLLVARKGRATVYPVEYREWQYRRDVAGGSTRSASEFRSRATARTLLAEPVPGTDAGPWLRGTAVQHTLWTHLFGNGGPAAYKARKGITTDANALFFLLPNSGPRDAIVGSQRRRVTSVTTDATEGRRHVTPFTGDVEDEHLFALLRGNGVRAFAARTDPDHVVLVPQRTMHGDASLPTSAPRTHAYLKRYREILASRGSYRRFQKSKPYWSLWSLGPYSFAPYKVAWREMPGGRFAAAMVGSAQAPKIGRRLVVPDHKVYFVPLERRAEAGFLTALLNAPSISEAVSAYAAALSLGVSVVEYLRLPLYDANLEVHRSLAACGLSLTRAGARGSAPSTDQMAGLDRLALTAFGVPSAATA